MSLKMSDLSKESGFSKSTILYYVKEGLLPKPKKPKPNLHLYDESSIAILEFIRYLQEHLNYSIAEIKSIIEDNKIDFSNNSDIVINYLSALSGEGKKDEIESIKKRSKEMGVDKKLFSEYEKCAKELAKLEYEIGAKLLESDLNNQNNDIHKLLFDIFLELKPYIFNQATIKEHKRRVKENLKGVKNG